MTELQNCVKEIETLMALSKFARKPYPFKNLKKQKSKRHIEKNLHLKFTIGFLKARLKSLHHKLFKIKENVLKHQDTIYNRKSIHIFESPMQWLRLSLKKIGLLQNRPFKNGNDKIYCIFRLLRCSLK